MVVGVGCGKEGLRPSLERARLRGLLIMTRRLEVSSMRCRKSPMLGTEIPEVTGTEQLLMDPP